MSVINRLASSMGRRDEEPNRELAGELAGRRDAAAVAELVTALQRGSQAIRSDCIKVLYEIGYVQPQLIAPHAGVFLGLLKSRNNRLVWGGMIALSTVADLAASAVFDNLATVVTAIETGSVITVDAGVSVLAKVSSANPSYGARIRPLLLDHLGSCRAKEVAQHAQRALPAFEGRHAASFVEVVRHRLPELTPSQQTRLKRVLR